MTVVLVAHGAGSSPDVAAGAFAGQPGLDVRSWWLRGHGSTVAVVPPDDGATDRAELAALAGASAARLLAGISYGAHQVARWAAQSMAARRPVGADRLLLMLPAWTGAPGPIAAATAAQAADFERYSIAGCLDRIATARPGWVADTLAASWPRHRQPQIVAALRAVALSNGPTTAELASLRMPVTVVAQADDPLHPMAVAELWADAIPGAELVTVRAAALADLGAAALSQHISGFR